MDFDQARKYLVWKVLKEKDGVVDQQVLAAMERVPRHLFVPEDQQPFSYENHPLPIGEGQTISQPYIVAFMTQAAEIDAESKVLEIGTGCGYQAAVLSEICSKVYSLEIIEHLAQTAKARLEELGYSNIFVKYADGYHGWKDQAPFDAILVTACAEEIPKPLLDQLKVGGRLIIPVQVEDEQKLMRIIKLDNNEIKKEFLLPVRFVPFTRSDKS